MFGSSQPRIDDHWLTQGGTAVESPPKLRRSRRVEHTDRAPTKARHFIPSVTEIRKPTQQSSDACVRANTYVSLAFVVLSAADGCMLDKG